MLDYLLGGDIAWAGDRGYYELESAIEDAAARLSAEGRRPYAIPIGGASVTGAHAYLAAADELQAQLDEAGVPDAVVVVADGSGGTHAGLVAGFENPGGNVTIGPGTNFKVVTGPAGNTRPPG